MGDETVLTYSLPRCITLDSYIDSSEFVSAIYSDDLLSSATHRTCAPDLVHFALLLLLSKSLNSSQIARTGKHTDTAD
jgi:hypothetical protein